MVCTEATDILARVLEIANLLAVLKVIFDFDLGPPDPRGAGGGSGLPFCLGNRWFWPGSREPNAFLI